MSKELRAVRALSISSLERNILTGPNLHFWLHHLNGLFDAENISYVLSASPPIDVPHDTPNELRKTITKWKLDDSLARDYMLEYISLDLRLQHEHMVSAKEILSNLKFLYGIRDGSRRFAITRELLQGRKRRETPVRIHVHKMIQLLTELDDMGVVLDNDFGVDVILQSLPRSYGRFIMDLNLQRREITVHDLQEMLEEHEASFGKKEYPRVMGATRPLRPGDWILRFGNGARASTEAIGEVELDLGGDRLVLRNALYVPGLVKNIISIPVLDNEGYEFYDPSRQTTFVSRNAHFLEKDFLLDKKEHNIELNEVTEAEKAEEVEDVDPSPQAVGEQEHETAPESTTILRRSERQCREPESMWTSDYSRVPYCCLIVHYIDEDWKVNSKVIAFKKIPYPPDGSNLFDFVKEMLLQWNFDKKLCSVVVDNATVRDWLCDASIPLRDI
ncbi:hypothetical protein RD792_006767 [Penstemon davidsonii]|uniref:Retrovirus-related Pol polyprotein from transposon TNT 1-94-like beta-barrel domain-containing protein n=1 Tax=Penstemon davidsonii TaxID=160366 RepID=A0ABR0DC00_9LAMI|nr:hypothetical protein RD792_006767 [Penstemon davidsonii]